MIRTLLLFVPFLFVGCVSVADLGGGRYAVPTTAEVRSPFGSNVVYGKLEDCEGCRVAPGATMQYRNCYTIKAWSEPMVTQGQGGQVAAGALNAVGLGVLGAVMPANGASAAQSQSITVTTPKGHR